MGLWTGLTERLQSPICNLFKSTFEVVNTANEGAKETVDVIEKPTDNIAETIPGIMVNNRRILPQF